MRRFRPVLFLLALAVVPLPGCGEGDPAPGAPTGPRVRIETSMGDVEVVLFEDQAPKTVATFIGLAEGTKPWTDATGAEQTRPFYDGLTFHRVIDGFMIQGGCPLGNGMGGPGFSFEDEINAKSLGLDQEKLLTKGRLHRWLGMPPQQFQQRIMQPLLARLGHPSDPARLRTLSPDRLAELDADAKRAMAEMSLEEAFELMGYRYDDALTSTPPRRGVLALANTGPNTNGSQFFITLEDTDHLRGKHTVFGEVVKGFDVVRKIGKVEVDGGNKPVQPVEIRSIRRLSPSG